MSENITIRLTVQEKAELERLAETHRARVLRRSEL
jgi:hypothetical protein